MPAIQLLWFSWTHSATDIETVGSQEIQWNIQILCLMCTLCFQSVPIYYRDNFGCHNGCRTPKKKNEIFKYYVLCANSVSKSVPIYYRDNFGCHSSCRTGYIEYAGHPIALVQLDTFGNRYGNRGVPRNTMKYSNIMFYVQIVFPNLFQFTPG